MKSNKIFTFFGYFFLTLGIIMSIFTIINYFSWVSKKDIYEKEYVYSEKGKFYYEQNESKVYINTLKNQYEKNIDLVIPDKNVILLYCNKSDCIQNDTSTLGNFITSYICLALSVFFLKPFKKNIHFNLYPVFIFIFILGLTATISESIKAINYFSLKKENNIVEATISSQIYSPSYDQSKFKPLAYYFVNGEKYLYVFNFTEGKLDDYFGQKIELYYDVENPTYSITKDFSINYFLIIIGIFLSITTFLSLFLPLKNKKAL